MEEVTLVTVAQPAPVYSSTRSALVASTEARKPVEIAVPYTVGLWQQTGPVGITLIKGPNVLRVELQQESRGVTVKDFTLTPMK